MSVVTFPVATAPVIARLKTVFGSSLIIAHDIPIPRPATFARCFRTGGQRASLVTDGPQLTFESWGASADVAESNAELVRAVVNDLPGRVVNGIIFYLVEELSGPGELPDPLSASRRFTWSAIVHVRCL